MSRQFRLWLAVLLGMLAVFVGVAAAAPPPPAPANLGGFGAARPSKVMVGANTSFWLFVRNFGPSPATGVTLSDTLPAGVSFVSVTPDQGTCTGTTTVTCSLGTLAVNQRVRVLIMVKATAAGSLLNQVSVTANEHDPNLNNNSFNQLLTVGPAPPVPPVHLGTLAHCKRGCKQHLTILTFFAPSSTTPAGSVDLMVAGTVRNLVVPTTVVASQVKNGQTVGPLGVEPGTYTISQQGSVLANATSTILCTGETTPSSLPHTITIAKHANLTCTITNTLH
jgi:uncharacterized repeat protein (TIGR01451 family)